jgi:hypothetical protein
MALARPMFAHGFSPQINSNHQSTATFLRGRAALTRLHPVDNSMKAQIAVQVTVDIAKIITALTGLVAVIAYIVRHS